MLQEPPFSSSDGKPPAAPIAAATPTTHRRDLLLGGAAVFGAATITFAMLMTRPTPASEPSARAVVASSPEASTAPAVPTGAAPWSDANASLWLGARRAGVAFEV